MSNLYRSLVVWIGMAVATPSSMPIPAVQSTWHQANKVMDTALGQANRIMGTALGQANQVMGGASDKAKIAKGTYLRNMSKDGVKYNIPCWHVPLRLENTVIREESGTPHGCPPISDATPEPFPLDYRVPSDIRFAGPVSPEMLTRLNTMLVVGNHWAIIRDPQNNILSGK